MSLERIIASALLVAGGLTATLYFARSTSASQPLQGASGLVYKIEAKNARWNHRVMDTPTSYVQGVPAEPVDSFVWDGIGSRKLHDASLSMRLDPIYNTVRLRVQWTDGYGKWTLEQHIVDPPPHYSGVQIGSSMNNVVPVLTDPVVTNAYLHGDTAAGPPVLPTVFALTAAWGFAEVTLNGKPFTNPYDPPAMGHWHVHTMLTVGVRDGNDGTVKANDGSIYDMSKASIGHTDDHDLEFHVTFHDDLGPAPMTGNTPPLFEFFYHLVFEDVEVQISHHD